MGAQRGIRCLTTPERACPAADRGRRHSVKGHACALACPAVCEARPRICFGRTPPRTRSEGRPIRAGRASSAFMLAMPRAVDRPRSIEREVNHRLRRINRTVGEDIARIRTDSGATKANVASMAGVDRTFLGRIESGDVNPSLATLVSIATAMGADLSIRIYAGSGPRLTDRHQSRMVESVLARLAPVWSPHLEVPVWRPARGVIDGVFERLDTPLLVVSEFMSRLPRLEQQIRWSAEKAASMASADLVGDRPVPPVSRLLVLRSTSATRQLAQRFELTLRSAYPGRTVDAVRSLTLGDPWPGDTLVWVRIEGDLVELMDRPPRGVLVGR